MTNDQLLLIAGCGWAAAIVLFLLLWVKAGEASGWKEVARRWRGIAIRKEGSNGRYF